MLKAYTQRNQKFKILTQEFKKIQKSRAIKKFAIMTKKVADYEQKILVAEVFNKQFMFQSSIKAWLNYSKNPEFKLAARVRV